MTCTHLISSDIIWSRGVFEACPLSVACLASLVSHAFPSGQASTPSGTVSTGTPLGAELSFRRPDTH